MRAAFYRRNWFWYLVKKPNNYIHFLMENLNTWRTYEKIKLNSIAPYDPRRIYYYKEISKNCNTKLKNKCVYKHTTIESTKKKNQHFLTITIHTN